jgi:hypothetical protein
MRGTGYAAIGGTSTTRRSAQLFMPARELHPSAPASKSQRNGAALDDMAQKQFPFGLERVVVGSRARHLLPRREKIDRLRNVGIPDGLSASRRGAV